MTDSKIRVGDVCIDLIERGKVHVVDVAAESVEQHANYNDYDVADYKANTLLPVRDDDPVFTVVYLPENPSVNFSGTYDMPRSRLARVPVEAAREDLRRTQTEIEIGVLARLFGVDGECKSDLHSADALAAVCRRAGFDPERVAEARELADIERSESNE